MKMSKHAETPTEPELVKKTTRTAKPRQLVSNRIKTPDGTILISRTQHDYVSHVDTITGMTYFVDGGLSYQRLGFSGRYENLSVYTDDSFDLIRSTMEWGTYGKTGKERLLYRTLNRMSNEHIGAIIETQPHISLWTKKIFIKELAYRKKKKILICD